MYNENNQSKEKSCTIQHSLLRKLPQQVEMIPVAVGNFFVFNDDSHDIRCCKQNHHQVAADVNHDWVRKVKLGE